MSELAICEKCGKPTEKIVKWPLFPGYEERVVSVVCDCEAEEMRKRKEEQEYLEKMEHLARLRDASMLDKNYKKARFSAYHNTAENKTARRYAGVYVERFKEMREKSQGLLFYGPVGTGKTYTAACIANELMDRMTPVVMTSFVTLLQKIQNNHGEEERVMAMVKEIDLLILDDLGAERNTEYALEKVYNIIDARVRAAKPMILTTNLDVAYMKSASNMQYQRIYDRVLERCMPVQIAGRSLREVEGARRYQAMQQLLQSAT